MNRMIIMRGLPGSGKSTMAKAIYDQYLLEYIHGDSTCPVRLSTDDIFMADGQYLWDFKSLGKAHALNQEKTMVALQKGLSPVIIDNTNTTYSEIKPYMEIGKYYNCSFSIRESMTDWAFEPEILFKKNSHGVPLDVINKMLQRWEPTHTVLEKMIKDGFQVELLD